MFAKFAKPSTAKPSTTSARRAGTGAGKPTTTKTAPAPLPKPLPNRPLSVPLVDLTCPGALALTEDQRKVLEHVNSRRHVFLTGGAGSGKTQTARALKEGLIAAGAQFALTASTGAAAELLGGSTLHSLLHMYAPDANERDENIKVTALRTQAAAHYAEGNAEAGARADKAARDEEDANAAAAATKAIGRLNGRGRQAAKMRLVNLEVLVVDEVSMVSAQTLYTAMCILRQVRTSVCPSRAPLPVIVLIGDFTQLLPVSGGTALERTAWRLLNPAPVVLTQIFRQKGDPSFLRMLNEVRMGKLTAETVALLRARESAVLPEDADPTALLAYRADVERANAAHLESLPGSEHVFTARVYVGTRARGDGGCWVPIKESRAVAVDNAWLRDVRFEVPMTASAPVVTNVLVPAAAGLVQTALTRAPPILTLKVGTKVMFTGSYPGGAFIAGSGSGTKLDADADADASAETEPKTADDLNLRVKVVNGTRGTVVGFDPWPVVQLSNGKCVQAAPLPRAQIVDNLEEAMPMPKPLQCPMRQRERLEMEGPLLVCEQVPLMLAKALTIHKAQGMTLEGPTRVSLRVFADGQAYVALSRLTGWIDLFLCDLDVGKITADKEVVAWYESRAVPSVL